MTGRLEELIRERGPIRKVGVVGMGYVGIPSAVLFAASPEYRFVWGFQRNSPTSGYKIDMLNRGECPLKGEEPELGPLLRRVVEEGKFRCTSDYSRVEEVDALTFAIQTPFLNPDDLEPDLRPLEEALRACGRHLTGGVLVVLESTVTPGTTGGMAREVLEDASGLEAGRDFALAHAPERVMVGRLIRNIREHDRIVGGIDPVSTRRAAELYRPVLTRGSIVTMSALAAEVTKTAENTFRDLQIAAVNQLALYCEAVGVNIYDVRAGIATLKGEGITRAILYPGAGVGGHCLTKDTYHLERGVHSLSTFPLDFPEGVESLYITARRINDFMPRHMFNLTRDGLARAGKRLGSSRIAVLGRASIANSDDSRNTPAAPYCRMMEDAGATVRIHDPYVEHDSSAVIERDLESVIRGADAVVIFTGHREYRELTPRFIMELSGTPHPVLVDGRNVIDPEPFIRAGFIYRGIGRGDVNNHPIVEPGRRSL